MRRVRYVSCSKNKAVAILRACIFIRSTHIWGNSMWLLVYLSQCNCYLHCCSGIQELKLKKFPVHSDSSFAILVKVDSQNPKSPLRLQTLFPIWLLGYKNRISCGNAFCFSKHCYLHYHIWSLCRYPHVIGEETEVQQGQWTFCISET